MSQVFMVTPFSGDERVSSLEVVEWIKDGINTGLSREQITARLAERHSISPADTDRVGIAFGMWAPPGGFPAGQ